MWNLHRLHCNMHFQSFPLNGAKEAKHTLYQQSLSYIRDITEITSSREKKSYNKKNYLSRDLQGFDTQLKTGDASSQVQYAVALEEGKPYRLVTLA